MEILKNRNFSLLFIGRILTNIGDSLYAVAAMWLVYSLGGSTLYTGIVGLLSIVPRVIQVFSGPMIDRIPLRGMLVYTQLLQAILLLIVPIAYYFDFLTVGLVLAITPILSTINMWFYPAQMSALPKILDKKQLTQGNSLFAFAYQGIDIACNAVSGVLIVIVGAVSLYMWNALGFFIGALLFLGLRIKPSEPRPPEHGSSNPMKHYLSDMKEGVRLIVATPLFSILFGIIIINAAAGATFAVLPAFADNLRGAEIYGALLMAQACGSLLGALLTPYLKLEHVSVGIIYAAAFCLSGALWSVSILAHWTWLIIIVYGMAWIPGGVTNVIINTVIQKGVPERSLGTVFAATSGLSGIAMPLGQLLGGSLGVITPSSVIVAGSGIVVLIVGVCWFMSSSTRQIPAPQSITELWLMPVSKVQPDKAPSSSV